jgi:hypothetical protein
MSDYLVYIYFSSMNTINLNQGYEISDIIRVPYELDRWYHIELRNIDWSARTFDYYVDGVLVRQSAVLSGTGSSISQLDLFCYQGETVYFDQFLIVP